MRSKMNISKYNPWVEPIEFNKGPQKFSFSNSAILVNGRYRGLSLYRASIEFDREKSSGLLTVREDINNAAHFFKISRGDTLEFIIKHPKNKEGYLIKNISIIGTKVIESETDSRIEVLFSAIVFENTPLKVCDKATKILKDRDFINGVLPIFRPSYNAIEKRKIRNEINIFLSEILDRGAEIRISWDNNIWVDVGEDVGLLIEEMEEDVRFKIIEKILSLCEMKSVSEWYKGKISL